jgi:hypothetical protein
MSLPQLNETRDSKTLDENGRSGRHTTLRTLYYHSCRFSRIAHLLPDGLKTGFSRAKNAKSGIVFSFAAFASLREIFRALVHDAPQAGV